MPYQFLPPVDPLRPLDESDPPPKGWKSVNDDAERRGKTTTCTFTLCQHWEIREQERHKKRDNNK